MIDKFKIYITSIALVAAAYLIYTLKIYHLVDIKGIILFVFLSIVAESIPIEAGTSSLSVGFAISMAAILIFGVPIAAWIACFGMVFRTYLYEGKRIHILNRPFYKTVFTGSEALISTGLAGMVYDLLGGMHRVLDLNSFILPLLMCLLVYCLLNGLIISGYVALNANKNFIADFLENIFVAIRDCAFVAPLGILMAIAYIKFSLMGILLFLGPLFLARYSYKLYIDMKKVYIETVKSLSEAMDAKDPYTKGHSMRVSEYAYKVGEKLQLSPRNLENLKMAAILHDIGKIGIEESILNKPGKLTDAEFDKIKQHPQIGIKIIQDIAFLKDISQIILSHHEKMDGTGYPNGLAGDEIPIEASILCVADVYDALTSNRPYRHALSSEQAITIIENGKDKHFKAKVADALIMVLREQEEQTA